jgi:O-antigen biosynthesis protein WbqP
MKRFFDLILAILLLIFFAPLFLIIAISIYFTSKGPILYWSDRVGINNKVFRMPKFRTMLINTPEVASHLLQNPDSFLSPIGKFLRKSSLDELPQLFSIISDDMSFVGPRPALFNQNDLIMLRANEGIDKLIPGITGWAQVNGRDELSIPEKVLLEVEYLEKKTFWLDLKILWMTLLKVLKSQGVAH